MSINLTRSEYIKALESLRKSGRDKVGLFGGMISTGIGTTGGIAASGMIASAAGASTFLGSSTLGSLLGGVFVTATPVGWVIGAAVGGAALAYGASRLVRSGSKHDEKRKMYARELHEKIERDTAKVASLRDDSEKLKVFADSLLSLTINNKISQEHGSRLLHSVLTKKTSFEYAYNTLQKI